MNLRTVQAAIFDMDGVLWRGREALPGLVELFQFLHERGIPYRLATNNSRRTQADYAAKLADLGVPNIPEENILTSGIVTAAYLRTQYPVGTGLYVIGGPGLIHELTRAGFALRDHDVSAVVVGIDSGVHLQQGAPRHQAHPPRGSVYRVQRRSNDTAGRWACPRRGQHRCHAASRD
jgi:HAD superfamily hydrolase (TIGR01450 family)